MISYAVSAVICLFLFLFPLLAMYRFYNSIVISDFRSNMVLPGYCTQFEWNVSEVHGAVSKSEICAGVFCEITKCYSDSK